MTQKPENTPKDKWLIQESLQQISQGPQAFMQWVKQNRSEFDHKFFNFLRKTIRFAEENQNQQLLQTLRFLESCFQKVFDLAPDYSQIVVHQDNYKQLWQQANQHLRQGASYAAAQLFHRIEIFFEANQKKQYHEPLYSNLGTAYAQLKQLEKAEKYFEKALKLSKNPNNQEKILANLANIYGQQGRHQQAKELFAQALTNAQKQHNLLHQVQHLNSLAISAIELNEVDEAIEQQAHALAIAEELAEKKLQVDCLTRLSVLWGIKGEKEKAEEFCRAALAVEERKD